MLIITDCTFPVVLKFLTIVSMAASPASILRSMHPIPPKLRGPNSTSWLYVLVKPILFASTPMYEDWSE